MSAVASLSGEPTGKMSGTAGHVVYFDWLKFLVFYGIVVYHTSLPFAYASWLIGSRDRSIVLTALRLSPSRGGSRSSSCSLALASISR